MGFAGKDNFDDEDEIDEDVIEVNVEVNGGFCDVLDGGWGAGVVDLGWKGDGVGVPLAYELMTGISTVSGFGWELGLSFLV